jgi:hypothetical protein
MDHQMDSPITPQIVSYVTPSVPIVDNPMDVNCPTHCAHVVRGIALGQVYHIRIYNTCICQRVPLDPHI